jgi:Zn-dependent M28 family amino/carboxypeptidase
MLRSSYAGKNDSMQEVNLLMPRYVAAFLVTLSLISPALAQNNASPFPPEQLLARIRPEGIRAHMAFLADDLLEGRGTGTRGYQLAANYIRAQFEALGLKPAGGNGSYFQNVRLRRIELIPGKTSAIVKRNGQDQTLVFDKGYVTRGSELYPDSTIEAPVVFVGYGVTAPEFGYDDYAGADVKGKIVAMLYGAPKKFPSAPQAHYSAGPVKSATAVAHGAIGTLSIWAGPIEERLPFSRVVRFFHEPGMRWLDEHSQPNDAQPKIRGSALVSSAIAGQMFEGASRSLKEALARAAESKPQAFALPVSIALHMVSRHSEVESPNIAAILPGSDPQLKNEYVVFTAHVDHLGIGEPINGDSIYNGAADDASGTAALLEIARALSSMPTPPRRSILFLAVTGEEEGLLGSDYFAHYPTVPLNQIVADVNMDGVTLFYDFLDVVPIGAEHSSLGPVVNDVAQHLGLEVSPDPMPEEVFFIRSDQYSFVKQGVPSVFLSEGFKTVDPKLDGKKISLEWEAKYYHTPKDDMDQPNLNFEAAAKCTRVDLAIGYEVAQQTERPRWNAGDFFAKFAAKTPSAGGH